MLSHLSIANLAIIDRLEASFSPGVNVITGETGAGKSIILGAVNLLLGGRADRDLIRLGASEAAVEGLFVLEEGLPSAEAGGDLLADLGLGGETVLRRVVGESGRSRAYVNNRLVGQAALAEIGSAIISISGQHEAQRLLKEEEHLHLLDAFGDLLPLRARAGQAHAALAGLRSELARLRAQEAARSERAELLAYQLDEIERADPRPGELEELEAEVKRLRHGQRLQEGAQRAHQALYAADESIVGGLNAIRQEIARLVQIDAGLGDLSRRLEEAAYALEDAAAELSAYADGIVFDPERQAQAEDRLALIKRLVRKYAETDGVPGVLSRAQAMAAELAGLKGLDSRLADLAGQLSRAEVELDRLCAELTRARQAASTRLDEAVGIQLADLGLEKARFAARLSPRPGGPGPDGGDVAAFLFCANPGEDLRPLSRVASGGELSRLTLALKSALAGRRGVETVVFDEVDSGIGGRVAEVVGRKLRHLGSTRQVICITHLAQIAAFGETHFRVSKETADGRTYSRIRMLDDQERVEELARMITGSVVSQSALDHARELLRQAGCDRETGRS